MWTNQIFCKQNDVDQICKGRRKYMNFNLNKWLLFLYFLPAAYPHFDVLFIFTGFLTNQFDKKNGDVVKLFF